MSKEEEMVYSFNLFYTKNVKKMKIMYIISEYVQFFCLCLRKFKWIQRLQGNSKEYKNFSICSSIYFIYSKEFTGI